MENKKRLIYLEDALSVMPALEMCTRALKKLPTVDAVEVVYGRWIKKNWSVTCSVCGSLAIAHDGKNYCPYCGAKMDGGIIDG